MSSSKASNSVAQESKQAVERLKTAIQAKRQADKNLATLEQSIALFEGSYLADTAASGGNIIKGFEFYMKTGVPGTRKVRQEVNDADRLFSKSSGSHAASIELLQNEATERARLEAEHQQTLAASQAANVPKTDTASPAARGGSSTSVPSAGNHKKRKREREESVMSEDKPQTPAATSHSRKRKIVEND